MALLLHAGWCTCLRSRPTRLFSTLLPPKSCSNLCASINYQHRWGSQNTKLSGKGNFSKQPSTKIVRVVVAGCSPREEFLAEGDTSFESLGIHPDVSEALLRAGFARPAKAQAIGIPKIFEGVDFLLGAETGSGKTIAYVAPLVSRSIERKKNADLAEPSENTRRALRSFALVLCPNGTLCKQVKAVADSLTTPEGESLVNTDMAYNVIADSSCNPDIVVATPGGLLSTLRDLDRDYANDWLAGVGNIVFDEADMLMTGGYSSKVHILVEMLRTDERNLAYDYISYALGLTDEEVDAIPKHLRRAAVQGGIQEMVKAGYEPEQQSAKDALQKRMEAGNRSSSRPPWHRQYIFVAATIPSDAKRNVANDIQRLCPAVQWATSTGLHRAIDAVEHEWIDISKSNPQEKLLKAVDEIHGGRTLVFTKDAATAGQVWEVITSAGFHSVLYHSKMRTPDSEKSLTSFRQKPDMIMVCTDAASRGLDVPNVACVIQADFASSAIDFLHRIGRTGRAGSAGKVVSLFNEDNFDLVNAIRQCIEVGDPIEGAFSRKRSFRKKFKRYGRYIPRGVTVPVENPDQ